MDIDISYEYVETIKDDSSSLLCARSGDPPCVIGRNMDIELIQDPSNPNYVLLLANNGDLREPYYSSTNLSLIQIYKLSGFSGKVLEGPHTVAENYHGLSYINGPEFIELSSGELGIIYSGSEDGTSTNNLYLSTRTGPDWNSFDVAMSLVNVQEIYGVGQHYPSANSQAPAGSIGMFSVNHLNTPFGFVKQPLGEQKIINVGNLPFEAVILLFYDGFTSVDSLAIHPTIPNSFYVSGCHTSCGIFGGLVEPLYSSIISGFDQNLIPLIPKGRESIRGAEHPDTNTTVWFVIDGNNVVHVAEEDSGMINNLGTFNPPVPDSMFDPLLSAEHMHVAISDRSMEGVSSEVIGYYQWRGVDDSRIGSYSINVRWDGLQLQATQDYTSWPEGRFSIYSNGTELIWFKNHLPSGKWRFFVGSNEIHAGWY